MLARACWPTSRPTAGSRGYALHLTFDARGQQSAKAMITARVIGPPEEIACVARSLGPIAISPANAPAVVDTLLVLP